MIVESWMSSPRRMPRDEHEHERDEADAQQHAAEVDELRVAVGRLAVVLGDGVELGLLGGDRGAAVGGARQ